MFAWYHQSFENEEQTRRGKTHTCGFGEAYEARFVVTRTEIARSLGRATSLEFVTQRRGIVVLIGVSLGCSFCSFGLFFLLLLALLFLWGQGA